MPYPSWPVTQAGLRASVAVLPLPDESAEVDPVPSDKCHRPTKPVASAAGGLPAQVVPQAPQLPPSVASVSQTIGTTTPTSRRPFVPAPIVCENVNPLVPVPVAVASTVMPPAAAAGR